MCMSEAQVGGWAVGEGEGEKDRQGNKGNQDSEGAKKKCDKIQGKINRIRMYRGSSSGPRREGGVKVKK